MLKEHTITTMKEIEEQLQAENKSGYAVICINKTMANRSCQIGYFKDICRYHGISYEHTKVEFISFVGWAK